MKKSLITLGAMSLALAGVAAGLVGAGNQAEVADAASAEGITFYLVPNANWKKDTPRFAIYYADSEGTNTAWADMTQVSDTSYYKGVVPSGLSYDVSLIIFCRMNGAKSTNSWDNRWNQTSNLSYTTGKNCYTVKEGAWDAGGGTWSTYSSTTAFTVTINSRIDEAIIDTPLATESGYSDVEFVPTFVAKEGKAFQGWFTDSSCTLAYTPSFVTADMTLYADYLTASTVKTVYFTANGMSNVYVYMFGGTQKEFGDWPGTKITTVTTGATLDSVGAVYKVDYHTEYKATSVIFNDGTASPVAGTGKTGDLTLASGQCYKIGDVSSGDDGLGEAAAFVYKVNAARIATTNKSYCQVSKTDAQTLVNAYDALGSAAKTSVDASKDYVQAGTDVTADPSVDVTFANIVVQLRAIAASTPGVGTTSQLVSDYSIWIVFGLLAVACAAGTGALVLSRRKKSR